MTYATKCQLSQIIVTRKRYDLEKINPQPIELQPD